MTAVDELRQARGQIDELKDKLRATDREVEALILHSCEEPLDHDNLPVLLQAIRAEHDRNHDEPWVICLSEVCRLASLIKG